MLISLINKTKVGFEIVLDTDVKYQVSEQIFSKFRLYKDKEFTEPEFEEFLKQLSIDKVHQKMLSILLKRRISTAQLKLKINEFLKKNNEPKLTNEVWLVEVEKFKELGMINDLELLKHQIEICISRKKGRNYIKQKLLTLGFDKELILSELENIEDNNENLEKLLKHKFASLQKSNSDKKKLFEKLVRFGIGRGFESGKIIKIAKSLLDNN